MDLVVRFEKDNESIPGMEGEGEVMTLLCLICLVPFRLVGLVVDEIGWSSS